MTGAAQWRASRPAWGRLAVFSLFCAGVWVRLACGPGFAGRLERAVAAAPAWGVFLAGAGYLALLLCARRTILVSGPARKVTWGLYLGDLPLWARTARFAEARTILVRRGYSFWRGSVYSVDLAFRPPGGVLTVETVASAAEAFRLAGELGTLIGCSGVQAPAD